MVQPTHDSDDIGGRTDKDVSRQLSLVGGVWSQVGSAKSSVESDSFGYSTSMSKEGRRVAVGAPFAGRSQISHGDGVVRVFDIVGNALVQLGADITEGKGEQLGRAVSMSKDGTRLAATFGSWRGDYVKVFELVSDEWVPIGNPILMPQIGHSPISMSQDGKRLAIGDGLANADSSGCVSIYEETAGSQWWSKIATIDGKRSDENFGFGLAMSNDGTQFVAGAPYKFHGGFGVGTVRVYQENANSQQWDQVGSDIAGTSVDDEFGQSVDIAKDGTRIGVGATGSHEVTVYDWSGSVWEQATSTPLQGTGLNRMTISMSTSGDRLAVGGDIHSGKVRVFKEDNGVWAQEGSGIDGPRSSWFGYSVSLSGERVAVTAPTDPHDSSSDHIGALYVYEWETMPTTAPTSSPTKCSNTNGKFTVPSGKEKGCGWLMGKNIANRLIKYCVRSEVQAICPYTCCDCGKCPTECN